MASRPLILVVLAGLVGIALVGTRRTATESGAGREPVATVTVPEAPKERRPGTAAPGRRGGLDVVCGVGLGVVPGTAVHGVTPARRGPDGRPLPPPRPAPFPRLKTTHPVAEESIRILGPDTPAREDLQIVQALLECYGRALGAQPAGDNGDIVAALTGENPKGLVFVPPSHPAIGRDGRLLDRWGTPIFFDSVSRTETRIRSAGPDKTLWTGDDLVAE